MQILLAVIVNIPFCWFSACRIYIPDILYDDSRIQDTLRQFNESVPGCPEFEPCPPTQRLYAEDILLAPCVVASRVGSDINAVFEKIEQGEWLRRTIEISVMNWNCLMTPGLIMDIQCHV